jgi:hypothetical protein
VLQKKLIFVLRRFNMEFELVNKNPKSMYLDKDKEKEVLEIEKTKEKIFEIKNGIFSEENIVLLQKLDDELSIKIRKYIYGKCENNIEQSS